MTKHRLDADAYIFDFDGTVADSMDMWSHKMLSILDESGVSYPDDIIKTITPMGDRGTAKYFVEKLGVNMTVDEIERQMNATALHAYTYTIQAKDTAAETVKQLKKEGFPTAILTASPHSMVDVCLKRLGLFEYFDYVWSCDDFKTTKTDPEIYAKISEIMSAEPSRCVLADDNINALTTAKAAGWQTIGVFDKSSADDEKEIQKITDIYVRNLAELL